MEKMELDDEPVTKEELIVALSAIKATLLGAVARYEQSRQRVGNRRQEIRIIGAQNKIFRVLRELDVDIERLKREVHGNQ